MRVSRATGSSELIVSCIEEQDEITNILSYEVKYRNPGPCAAQLKIRTGAQQVL